MKLKNIPLGPRLTLAFGIILAGLLFVSAVGCWTIDLLAQDASFITQANPHGDASAVSLLRPFDSATPPFIFASRVMVSTVAICFVLAVLMIWTITRSITGPLQEVNEALVRIGNGDLTVILTYDSKDELGRLCSSVNKLVSQLNFLPTRFVDSTKTLDASASQLTFVVEKVTAAS